MRARLTRVAGLLLLGAVAWQAGAVSDGAERRSRPGEPHAGYVYPAGGQVGTTVRVWIGGQYLRQVDEIQLSGGGVTAKIVYWIPPPRPIDADIRRELARRLRILRSRRAPTTGSTPQPIPPPKDGKAVELPRHPLLDDLEKKTLEELEEVESYFFQRLNPLQRKRAIEETVKVDLTIAPDAEPGMRELRLVTKAGLSNPLRFRVGLLPEVREREPNGPGDRPGIAHDLPIVVNGQILPNDVDRHRFLAKAGQKLVLRAEARTLIPYQADSVPGWMQATLTLYDAEGKEVAYADEYRFNPDPVLFYEVPKDGAYELEVCDAIARGRQDFVYRVAIGELPFITRVFPLGGRCGELTRVQVEGWNLRQTELPLDTRACNAGMRRVAWRQQDALTNEVAYAVDDLPEVLEVEGNDTTRQAQDVQLPIIVNGRIGQPGDKDVFRVEAKAPGELVAEVRARTLGSPLDSLLRVYDDAGAVIAWNDDEARPGLGVRGLGLQTHHADSYVVAKLPKRGTYYVQISDVRIHGGEDHAYRLRISTPQPDVELYVTPSALNLDAGRAEPVSVYAIRRDGFEGEIDLVLEGGGKDFALGGARIPEGRDHVEMTLTAPPTGPGEPVALKLVGVFKVDQEVVRRPVMPADNVMQAFLWRHLVPAEEFSAHVRGNGRWVPIVTLAEKNPVKLKRGGTTRISFLASRPVPTGSVVFDVIGGPTGVTVERVENKHDGFVLVLKTSREAEREKVVDNLIIEAFGVPPQGNDASPRAAKKKGKSKQARAAPEQSRSLGVLPAVPYVIER